MARTALRYLHVGSRKKRYAYENTNQKGFVFYDIQAASKLSVLMAVL